MASLLKSGGDDEKPMSFLPPDLQGYSPIVMIVLLFVDGALFGVAVKKALVSLVLVMVAIVLAGFIGLNIPFLSVGDVWSHVINIFFSQARHIGPIFYGFPVFWIIGFAIGIWKG